MNKTCAVTGQEFVIPPLELDYCEKFDLPLPTVSPFERLRHMLIFRNRMHLFRTKCAHSGKPIFSAVPPECGTPVYEGMFWESDEWDARDFGRDYDFTRPFFAQFHELFVQVPRPNLGNGAGTLENCEYTNGIARAKNCYLLFSSHGIEDCHFSRAVYDCKDIVDSILIYDSEICYDCENVKQSYNLKSCSHCGNCRDSAFLVNCFGCKDCYGCVNLYQKQYCFFNEQLSKEEYDRKISEIDLGSHATYQQQKKRFNEFRQKFPIKLYFGAQNEDVTGDFINNSKNCYRSYFISKSEDVEHSLYLESARNSIVHVNFGGQSEFSYNCISVGENSYNLKFCSDTWNGVRDLEYCVNVRLGTHDCFGCVSLKRASYCILNKQYKKDEYFDLLKRVKAHMRETGEYGQFFPTSSAPNCYNRSDVEEFFPMPREEAIKRGFTWHDEEESAEGKATTLPDHIEDTTDDVLNQTLACELTGKSYKLVKPELAFYRKHRLPAPRTAPLERVRLRCSSFLTVKPVTAGQCAKCQENMLSCYLSGEQPVYCEDCFQQEVF